MNNMYKIFKTEHKNYKYFVIALTSDRIDEYINNLENELKSEDYNGIVVFDLMSCNGPSNRFFEAEFISGKFKLLSFKKKDEIPNELLFYSNEFVFNNLL